MVGPSILDMSFKFLTKVHPWKKIIQDEEGNSFEDHNFSGITYGLIKSKLTFFSFSQIVLELAPENSKTQENDTTAEMRKPGKKNKTETGGINKLRLRVSDDPEEECHNYITESAA